MRILTVPQDTAVLRIKSQPVKTIDAELMAFLRDLGKTLKDQKDPAGVGLSAIQVGRPIRAFAIFLPEPGTRAKGQGLRDKGGKLKLIYYINPEIVDHPKDMTLGEDLVEDNPVSPADNQQLITNNPRPFLEGCLSIPDIYGPVLRWPLIKAKACILTEQALSPNSVFPARHRLSPKAIAGGSIQYSVFTLEALTSRVFQHELDHLNGILFTDHVLAQGNRLYQDSGNGMEEVNL